MGVHAKFRIAMNLPNFKKWGWLCIILATTLNVSTLAEGPSAEVELLPPLDSESVEKADNEKSKVLTLFQAEELALKNSPTLQSSRYSAMVRHEQLGQWLHNIYPQVSVSAGLSHSGTIDSGSAGGRSISLLTTSVTARQSLLDFSRRPRLRKAELAESSALADLESDRQDLLLNVRKAWFTCYIDQDLLDIARETANNRAVRLNEAEQHYKNGLKAKSDVVSAQADLAEAQYKVIEKETRLKLDWVSLNTTMGLAESEPYRLVLDPYWEDFVNSGSESFVATALSNRPELLDLQAQLKSALYELEIINSEKYPTVDLSGSLSGAGSITPFTVSWSLGVSLNWTIFDGFLRKYEKSAQKLQARVIAQNFEAQRIKIYQEVKSAEVSLLQSQAAITSAEYALASAKEKYRLASARYKVGVSDSVELSNAELTLSQAQTDYANARNNLRLAKASMIRALGIDDMDNLPTDNKEIILDTLPDIPAPYSPGGEKE
ncbi:TolC family protein [bacterium]|nr:TolC family protein [bacterium]